MKDERPPEPQQTDTLPLTGRATIPAPEPPKVGSPPPEWLSGARSALPDPGKFILYEDSGGQRVVAINREWTRIGRSLSADIRFDDTTVSRRHALVIMQAEGIRVLDDRSLNGIYVNGQRVEWSVLSDGDEITIGRHRLFFIDTTGAAAAQSGAVSEERSS